MEKVLSSLSAKSLKRPTRKTGSENLEGYLFISPWIIGFLVFTIFPMFSSLYYSFTKYDLLTKPKWIGLSNYINIFTQDTRFIQSVKVTFSYAIVQVPVKLFFALMIALLFKSTRRMVGLYRTIYYIPSIFGGSIAVSIMWRQLFGKDGAFNAILLSLGILKESVAWISTPNTALWMLVVLAVWQFGSPMLIFLAGLKQIPSSYYEAASIDGASKFQQFCKITFPCLSPVIFFNFLMQTIGAFMAFTQGYVITGNGGPVDSTLFYALYIYQKAFQYYEMGYGAALAWILLIIVAIITAIIFKISNYLVYYETKAE